MVKIAGKPLLEQTLRRLKASKFSEVIISIGEGGDSVENYFGDGSRFGISISYLYQKEKNGGNAQPVAQAKELLAGGPFLLLYGDVLSACRFWRFSGVPQISKIRHLYHGFNRR